MGVVPTRPPTRDVVVALAASAVVAAEVAASDVAPAAVVLAAMCPAPLAWRRQAPLAVLLTLLAGVSLLALVEPDGEWVTPFAAVLAGLYAVAAYAARRPALVGLGAVLVFFTSGTILDNLQDPGRRPLGDLLYMSVLNASTWAVGRIVRRWREQALALAEKTEELERERAWREQAAVAEERNRIARELHDVISHSVSLMVIQAAAAEQVLGGAAPEAAESIQRIQQTGRQAVDELRRLLGVLRPRADAAAFAPQPTLDELPAMLRRAEEAGLRTELRVEGAARPLAPGVELVAYRLVQEAVTNALKHAGPGTPVSVALRFGDDVLAVEVLNDSSAGQNGAGHGTGHGLAGMRERLALYGGALEAGPCEAGFAVRARIPLSPSGVDA